MMLKYGEVRVDGPPVSAPDQAAPVQGPRNAAPTVRPNFNAFPRGPYSIAGTALDHGLLHKVNAPARLFIEGAAAALKYTVKLLREDGWIGVEQSQSWTKFAEECEQALTDHVAAKASGGPAVQAAQKVLGDLEAKIANAIDAQIESLKSGGPQEAAQELYTVMKMAKLGDLKAMFSRCLHYFRSERAPVGVD